MTPPAAAPAAQAAQQSPAARYSAPPQSATAPSPQPRAVQPPYQAGLPVGSEPLTVGQYIGMFLLLMIPLVNIVLLFVWAFGSGVNLNRKNYARASLIFGIISFIIFSLLALAGGIIAEIFSDMMYSL